MTRVLVCGDRNWTNWATIYRKLITISDPFIIEGHARGADIISYHLRMGFEWPGLSTPADWARYGKAAGPIRNQEQLDNGKPELGIAFHNDIAHSKGTADMVRRLRKAGIPVEIITEQGDI